jgi:hypothetical protein
MLRTFGRHWATPTCPAPVVYWSDPTFRRGCVLESILKRASVPCPETGSRTASITAPATLAIIGIRHHLADHAVGGD